MRAPAKAAAETTTRRGPGRPRKATVQFQAPLIEEPEPQPQPEDSGPERPTMHNGVQVVREELVSALPHGKAPFRFTRLHLSDGTQAFGCRDCLETRDTRGAILLHRNDAHGARNGKKPPHFPKGFREVGQVDLVLPPRANGPAPADVMQMTIGEVVGLMPSIGATGNLIDRLEAENEALRSELSNVKRIDKASQHKIDVYDMHRTELIELRLQVAKQGNYEEIKAELYELRAWKKKFIAKLNKIGFKLSEEDE